MDTYKLNMICRKLNHLSNGLRSIRNLKENFCKKAKKNTILSELPIACRWQGMVMSTISLEIESFVNYNPGNQRYTSVLC